MASSTSSYLETKVMDALFNNVSPAALQLAGRWIQLHTGAPTKAGTANVAGNNVRVAITGAASSGGVFTSTNDLIWTSVSTTETYTDVSLWDASSAGNCLWIGSLAAPQAVTVGDNFSILTGQLTVTLN